MNESAPDPVSSLPRTLETALRLSGVRFAVWARSVVPAAEEWGWQTLAFDHDRLWIVDLGPVNPATDLPMPALSRAWEELDRRPFEHAGRQGQFAMLSLLDEIYCSIAAFANITPTPETEDDHRAATRFLTMFAAQSRRAQPGV